MEQDQEKGKPMQVTVVTLLVYPEQSERLALASTEGKIQLALRNPLDTSAPETPGIKQAGLLGTVKAAPKTTANSTGSEGRKVVGPVTPETTIAAPLPTVEMIRGDKRSSEVIK
jgi:pilus assembly protein CpaB